MTERNTPERGGQAQTCRHGTIAPGQFCGNCFMESTRHPRAGQADKPAAPLLETLGTCADAAHLHLKGSLCSSWRPFPDLPSPPPVPAPAGALCMNCPCCALIAAECRKRPGPCVCGAHKTRADNWERYMAAGAVPAACVLGQGMADVDVCETHERTWPCPGGAVPAVEAGEGHRIPLDDRFPEAKRRAVEAVKRSEVLTGDDMAVRVNAASPPPASGPEPTAEALQKERDEKWAGLCLNAGGMYGPSKADRDRFVEWERELLRAALLRSAGSREKALEEALRGMLLAADASWEEQKAGHDWPEAVAAAREALERRGE